MGEGVGEAGGGEGESEGDETRGAGERLQGHDGVCVIGRGKGEGGEKEEDCVI